MSERQNTVVCSFDPKSPRISALDIHEWIFEQLHVPESVVAIVQTDGTRRQVYIKFTDFQYLQDLLRSTTGQSEYKHANAEISQVKIEMAGMGTRRVRLAKPSPWNTRWGSKFRLLPIWWDKGDAARGLV